MDIRVTRGLCALLLAYFTAAEAVTLQVGLGTTFARIEAAVAAAAPGDTIRVLPLPNGSAYEGVAVLVGTLYPWPGIAAAGDAALLAGLPATPGASGGPPPLAGQYLHPLGDAVRPVLERPDLWAHPVPGP